MHGIQGECMQDFGGKTKKEEPLGKPRHRWEDNIVTILVAIDGVWTDLTYFL
jgi:hypothetical protein